MSNYVKCLSMVHSRSFTHMCGHDDGHTCIHRCWKCGLIWREEQRVNTRCGEIEGGTERLFASDIRGYSWEAKL